MKRSGTISAWYGLGLIPVLAMAMSSSAAGAEGAPTPPAPEAAAPASGSGAVAMEGQSFDDWKKSVKNPTPWLNWGGDLRVREKYLHLSQLGENSATHERHIQRYRTRLWGTLTPVENLEFGFRLAYEGRHYETPDIYNEWYNGPLYFDQLYVKAKKVFDLPLTATLGRFDMTLGDGWLVSDPTPMDGSRTGYFDGVRLQYEMADIKTTIDASGVVEYSESNAWLPTINNDTENQTEQNERGAILWVTNKSIEGLELNPYFIYYHADKENGLLFNSGAPGSNSTGIDADIYTVGLRAVYDFDKNWKANVEGAGQFGNRNGQAMEAYGAKAKLTYAFLDDMKTSIRGGYEFLSGNETSTSDKYEGWDPLWGRCATWSEYLLYAWAGEGRIGEMTNLHRFYIGTETSPMPDLTVSLDYHFLLAPENPMAGTAGFTDNGDVRGHLLALCAKYKFSNSLSTRVNAEAFFPGNYYQTTRDQMGAFVRWEFVVTF